MSSPTSGCSATISLPEDELGEEEEEDGGGASGAAATGEEACGLVTAAEGLACPEEELVPGRNSSDRVR